jgi:hypothetical protein
MTARLDATAANDMATDDTATRNTAPALGGSDAPTGEAALSASTMAHLDIRAHLRPGRTPY